MKMVCRCPILWGLRCCLWKADKMAGWLARQGRALHARALCFVTAPQDNGTFSWEHSQLDRLWDEHKSFKGFHVELDNRPHCVLRGNEVLLTYRENSLRPGASWEAPMGFSGKWQHQTRQGRFKQAMFLKILKEKKKIYLSIYLSPF